MENKQRPSLKMVRLGEYRMPKHYTPEMKKFARKLIEELVSAKMLAQVDLPLVWDYVDNIFLLEKVNGQILQCSSSAELKRLMTIKNGCTNNMLKQSNALGLNAKARSTGFTEVTERFDFDSTSTDIDVNEWGE